MDTGNKSKMGDCKIFKGCDKLMEILSIPAIIFLVSCFVGYGYIIAGLSPVLIWIYGGVIGYCLARVEKMTITTRALITSVIILSLILSYSQKIKMAKEEIDCIREKE